MQHRTPAMPSHRGRLAVTVAPGLLAMAVVATLVASHPPTTTAAGFTDVLDHKAAMSPLASRSWLQAVSVAGKRLVAVGQRGTIVVSDDGGRTWQQSAVPVSSDLTAVYFVDAKRGWAVGQDGVVLHTADGGENWRLQLDGRKANEITLAAMQARAGDDSEAAKALLAEAHRNREQGPDKPFLDVWFADASEGYVVGAYNLVFHTTDGGGTWQSWFDRTENPKFFNLYAIRRAGNGLFIAGEGGLLLKLDPASGRFRSQAMPYNGSLFGLVDAGSAVLAFGLRGNVLRSDDGGITWSRVEAGLASAVVAGAQTAQGSTLLADAGGRVAATHDGGRTFRPVTLARPMPLTGVAETFDGRLALTGPRGVLVTEAVAR
jgi:photosystem II stability/assembly factor-like uncharacterized protein